MTYEVTTATSVTTTGTAPEGSSATFKNTYTNNKVQVTNGKSMTLTLSGYAGYKITGITMRMKSNQSSGSGNFSMKAGTTLLSSISNATFKDAAWNGAYTQDFVDVTPTMSNADYAIANGENVVITIAATVNSLYCQSFTITYEKAGSVTPTVETPKISPSSKNFNLGESVEVTIEATAGATIYYTINGDTPTTGSTTYSKPFEITKTTTVKAIAVMEGYNDSKVAEETYTAIDPNAKTANVVAADLGYENAADVEQIQIGDYITVTFEKGTSDNTTKYYTKGMGIRNYNGNLITFSATEGVTINSIVFTASSASYKENPTDLSSGKVTIDGAVTTISNIAANTLSFTQSSNTSQIQQIEVSYSIAKDAVIIANPTLPASSEFYGYIDVEITNNAEGTTLYYSTDNVEFVEHTQQALNITITETTTVYAYAQDAEGNKSGTVSATYTRVAAAPEISCDGVASAFEGSITVTISTENNAKAYYTLNGKTPTASSTLYQAPLSIGADATLKVIAIEEGGYKSDVVEKEFKKAVSTVATGGATLVTDAADLAAGDKIILVANNVNCALSTTQNTNNRGQTDVTKNGNSIETTESVQIISLEKGNIEGTFAFNTGNGYLYAASSSNNYLKTKSTLDNNGCWEITITSAGVATIKAQGTNTHNWLRYNGTSKLFSCYESGQADVNIYEINTSSIEAYTLTVSSAGWATLFLNYDAVIPAGAKCYYISEVKSDAVTLTEISNSIPANTAVIVEAEAGSYTFNVATEDVATIESNMAGRTAAEYVEEDAYILAKVDDNIGFYPVEKLGGVFLCYANRAYLPASALTAEQQNSVGFRFDFATTAVEKVEMRNEKEEIYDLQGRRINEITEPGIYIVNGVKRVVR
ncbi:MAG: chitobiase/beta-hexosaminidase C-terminal domain-containing protein [Ruminococcus sp.]|nr:chitobiase/beta-hexosaminidase C-terminal domain-containing protein [Ruminococcus sp.]